jgi:hypothetical protein
MKRALLTSLICAALAGCNFTHMNTDTVDRPDVGIGTGAAVIYPGEAGPVVQPRMGQPGAEEAAPGLETTMIGGMTGESVQARKEREVPFIGPLTVLFGYPFWLFGKNIKEKADAEVAKQNSGAPQPTTPDEAERQRLARENEKLREELLQGNAPALGGSQIRPRSSRGGAADSSLGSSISAELAALERSLSGGPAQSPSEPPTPGASPTPPPDPGRTAPPELAANGSRRAIDRDGDGRMDRLLVFDDQDRLARTEEDLDGDGNLESITVYEDGEVVRRRLDSDGDGVADSWSFFRAGEMVRHEVDRDGDGFRDLVMLYDTGQLVREEEDANGDGRADIVVRYVGGEIEQRDEDIDFDGVPDVQSFYEGGKLVRREVHSEAGMERAQSGAGS